MRILRVAQSCYPDVTGGGAYHVHAMSRDQAALDHEVTVLTVRQDADRPHVEEREGYTVVRFDKTASPLGNDCSAGLARYLHWAVDALESDASLPGASADFDVVHAHSHLYAATNLAALERRLADTVPSGPAWPSGWIRSLRGSGEPDDAVPGRDSVSGNGPPLAITNHGLYSQAVSERAFDWYLRSLGRWTLDTADVVFCYTDVDRRRLRELGVATDVAVVPNGVDTGRFSPDGPAHPRIAGHGTASEGTAADGGSAADGLADDGTVGLGIAGDGFPSGDPSSDGTAGDGPAVLFVGRLVQGKRPGDAIAAIERVRESLPDATLYVCGDGPLRAELEARATPRADADTGPGVVFLGHLDYDEMPGVYRAVNVLVLPSRTEGMPRTVLEARASGTPVVATDLEQLRSLEDGGVHTVPLGDVDAIADALVEVLAADDGRSTRHRGRRRAVAQQSVADGGTDRPGALDGGTDRPGALDDGTNRPGALDDGTNRPGALDDGTAAATAEPPQRNAYDWTATVRRTTAVLRDLCEGSR